MTTQALERAEKAAKCEIDRLRKRRVEVASGRFADGLGWENLDEIVSATTRAVLMAVRDEKDVAEMVYAVESRAHMDWSKIWPEQIDAILGEGEGE